MGILFARHGSSVAGAGLGYGAARLTTEPCEGVSLTGPFVMFPMRHAAVTLGIGGPDHSLHE